MKILVIGSTGLVGSAIRRVITDQDTYIFENHNTLEIKDSKQLEETLISKKPDVVINTAAYLGVEPCAGNPVEAFAVNALAAGDLAKICHKNNICLMHISTDGVFDGTKGDFYTEKDMPHPVNVYGITKYMGELLVESNCSKYYIVRLPILFGVRENRGLIFIEKMHSLVKSGKKELRVADDIISCPSFSDDIAKGLIQLITSKPEYGVYHLKNEGAASLYEFAKEFFEKLGSEVVIYRAKARDFVSGEKDKKPLDTSMKSIKISSLRNWKDAMTDFIIQFREKER